MLKRSVMIFSCLLVVLFVFACTDHNIAIYYFIENEQTLAQNTFSNGRSINGMDKLNGRTYIAAAPSMWTRQTDTSNWVQVNMAPGAQVSTGLAFFNVSGDRLYAGFDNGLYYTTAINGETAPGWTPVLTGTQVIRVKKASDTLFVSTSTGGSNTLYSISNATGNPVAVTGLTGISNTIEDVAYDSGAIFLAVAGGSVYSGSTNSMTTTGNQPSTSGKLYGIIRTANNYYTADDKGNIFYTANPGTATWSNTGPFVVSNNNVQFRHFAQISTNGLVLLGTFGYGNYGAGYYSTADTATPSFTRVENVAVQQLYYGVVDDFFIDTSTKTVYTLNHGTGIWKNSYNDTTGTIPNPKNWSQE